MGNKSILLQKYFPVATGLPAREVFPLSRELSFTGSPSWCISGTYLQPEIQKIKTNGKGAYSIWMAEQAGVLGGTYLEIMASQWIKCRQNKLWEIHGMNLVFIQHFILWSGNLQTIGFQRVRQHTKGKITPGRSRHLFPVFFFGKKIIISTVREKIWGQRNPFHQPHFPIAKTAKSLCVSVCCFILGFGFISLGFWELGCRLFVFQSAAKYFSVSFFFFNFFFIRHVFHSHNFQIECHIFSLTCFWKITNSYHSFSKKIPPSFTLDLDLTKAGIKMVITGPWSSQKFEGDLRIPLEHQKEFQNSRSGVYENLN